MKISIQVICVVIGGLLFSIQVSAQEQTEQIQDDLIQDRGQEVGDTNTEATDIEEADIEKADIEKESTSTSLTITTDGVTTTGTDNILGSAYVCTLNDVQRRVEIDLLEAPSPVPCEVNYYKDTEAPGTKTTLWSARNDSDYCEIQAKAFIEKLQTMNWACSGG